MDNTTPQRKERLQLDVQGDSVEALASLLRHIALEYEMGHINDGCTGGIDSGGQWERTTKEDQTPENYQAELAAYVKTLKG